jgi:hypothetical protein
LSQLLFLLLLKRWRRFLYALTIPSIAFLPWLPSFFEQLAVGQALRATFPGWENIVSFSLLKAPVLTFGKFLFGVIDLELITPNAKLAYPFIFTTGLFLVLVLGCLLEHSAKFYRQHQDKIVLCLFTLILPFVLATLASIFVPVIQPKRVIFLLPFAYLLLAFLILATRDSWRELRPRNWALLSLVLVLNFYGIINYYTQPVYQREDWRAAIKMLHDNYSPTDTVVVFSFAGPFAPWQWYERQHPQIFPTLSTGTYDVETLGDQLNTIIAPAANYQNIIIFDYLRNLTDPKNALPAAFERNYYAESANFDYNTLGFIRIYTKQN